MDDELVDLITMTSASTAEAKDIAALVYGGPSAYDRWAYVKNMLLRRTWASTDAWKRGTQNDQERASNYRILQMPQATRDSVHATMICRMRLTQKEAIPFEYKGRPNWAPLEDLYEAVACERSGMFLTVQQKGNREKMNALGQQLNWNWPLIAYIDR